MPPATFVLVPMTPLALTIGQRTPLGVHRLAFVLSCVAPQARDACEGRADADATNQRVDATAAATSAAATRALLARTRPPRLLQDVAGREHADRRRALRDRGRAAV